MKTTLRIFVAAFLFGIAGQILHAHPAATLNLRSAGPHFSLVRCPELAAPSRACRGEGSAVEPTEMSACATTLSALRASLSYEDALQILTAAHAQYWYDEITLAELVQRYEDGVCTIDPVPNGYKVNAGGGLGTELILGTF